MRPFLRIIILIWATCVILLSCEENTDLSDVSYDYIYNGSFAFPVGRSVLTLEKMGIGLPKNWLFFPELLELLEVIKLSDTLNFNLNNLADSVSYIHSIELNMSLYNKFPTSGYLTLLLIDTLGNVSDTLIDEKQGLFEAAKIMGDSTIAENSFRTLSFTSYELGKWGAVNRLAIGGFLVNLLPDNTLYKNFNQHTLTIEIGAIVRFNFNLNKLSNE